MISFKIKDNLNSIFFGCFFSFLLVTDDSYKLSAFPLALLALFSINKNTKAFSSKTIKITTVALLSYFIVTALSYFINGGDLSDLDMPSRVVIASCILALAYSYPPSVRALMFSICIGAISSGIVSIYQSIEVGGRAFIHHGYMVIQAGGIASALSVLAIVIFLYALKTRDNVLKAISIGAIILGLIAVFLSGARGAWIPLPFIIFWLFTYHRHMLSTRVKLYSAVILSFVVIFSYSNIKPRIESAVNELVSYQDDSVKTSSGARLEMWKSSIYSGIDKPIFGQGFNGVRNAKEKQVSEGLVDSIVLRYNKAHNQFFEELQTKGLIGLITILFFFGVPLMVLINKFRDSNEDDAVYYTSLMGIAHIISVIGFSMTQHYLSHHSGIIFYSFGMAIFVGMSLSPNLNKKEVDS